MVDLGVNPCQGLSSVLLLSRPSADSLRSCHGQDPQVRCYRSHFSDCMEMRASHAVVARHLDRHDDWFRRCAAPMQVEALDAQTYALTLGRFGNFGFEVEPTIALRLLPVHEGTYAIETVTQPDRDPTLAALYDVDFQAGLTLNDDTHQGLPTTCVRWELDLSIWISLPKVITMLPEGLVQSSGDRLLRQIVRQISRRLTWKVQEDFHGSHGLVCPPRRRATF
mgnify:CR=1 FL=1